nr:hypothetical protein [Brevundimonas aurantiaca]
MIEKAVRGVHGDDGEEGQVRHEPVGVGGGVRIETGPIGGVDRPARQEDPGVRQGRQLARRLQTVGHHRQIAHRGDPARQPEDGGAGIQQQGHAWFDQLGRVGRDPLLGLGVDVQPLPPRRLGAAIRQADAAVHLTHRPVLLQPSDVAADRLLRHVKGRRQIGDRTGALIGQGGQ